MSSPMYLVQPSGELLETLRKDRNEDVKTRDSYVALIKDWLKQQPHLPDDWDSHIILNFLRGCNFSMEKCKNKIDMHFTMKTLSPEWSTGHDITSPPLQAALAYGSYTPLPGLTPEGNRIIISTGSVRREVINGNFSINMMTCNLRLKDEVEGVGGEVLIVSPPSENISHVIRTSLTDIHKIMIHGQKGYPAKLKEVHLVNASVIAERILAALKSFLTEKMKRRVFFHSDIKSLHKYVPKEMLPEELGGDLGPLRLYESAWLKELEKNKEWFKEEEAKKSNESLRPGKPTSYSDVFGIEGSFRQLDID